MIIRRATQKENASEQNFTRDFKANVILQKATPGSWGAGPEASQGGKTKTAERIVNTKQASAQVDSYGTVQLLLYVLGKMSAARQNLLYVPRGSFTISQADRTSVI